MLGSIPRKPRVLIIEDNDAFVWTLSTALEASGVADVRSLHPDSSAEDALGAALQWRADVVVLDVDLRRDWSGLALAAPLERCGMRVILATATPGVVLPKLCKAKIYDKARPWSDLMAMVRAAVRRQRVAR